MTWQDVARKILTLAPQAASLAAPFLGPAGPILPVAVKALCSYFRIDDPDPKPEVVLAAIEADPQATVNLRMAQIEFDRERMRLEYADTQNARQRQTEHERVTGKSDTNLYVLAWVVVGGFLGLTGFLIWFAYKGVPIIDQSGVLYMLLGTLSTAFGMVMGYFFGSSRGSRDKDELLLKAIPPSTRK